ncbi:MAG: hypothetical protein M3Z24_13920 [Chloroflexota bacterium]|nr:hypothetical protein [Chloroflexota bacterium]
MSSTSSQNEVMMVRGCGIHDARPLTRRIAKGETHPVEVSGSGEPRDGVMNAAATKASYLA